jgi:hypothetical protein
MNNKYLDQKQNIIDYIKKIIELDSDYIVDNNIAQRFRKKYKMDDYIEMVLSEFLE